MKQNSLNLFLAVSTFFLCTYAHSQEPSILQTTQSAISPQTSQASPTNKTIPNGTLISLEITELLSTKTNVRDEMFGLKLTAPITFNGEIIIPAGTIGKGQIIDSGKPRIGGSSGQLVIAARYLEFQGQRIPIRGLKLEISGRDRSSASIGLSSVGTLAGPAGAFAGLLVSGGHMEIPAGSPAIAKLGADYVINTNSTKSNNGN